MKQQKNQFSGDSASTYYWTSKSVNPWHSKINETRHIQHRQDNLGKDGINLNIIYVILDTMFVNNVTHSASMVGESLGPNNRTLGNSINQGTQREFLANICSSTNLFLAGSRKWTIQNPSWQSKNLTILWI